MPDLALTLITLGGLFLAGLAADQIGRNSLLPRVTLLLACGIIVGRPGLDLIPDAVTDWYEFFAIVALTMVAFLLGGSLRAKNLRAHGRAILTISLAIVLVTLCLVAGGLWFLGLALGPALVLGAIATATAPASMQDVIAQSGASGPFVDTLKGIVAIDDAWGLVAFSLVLVIVNQIVGDGGFAVLVGGLREIGGSLLLGVAIGVPAAYLTGRLSGGEPLRTEALGIVFLTAGLAIWLHLSYLIAGMTAGALIVNRARHHKRAFHQIEHIQWPFMLVFFILAGSQLDLAALAEIGVFGALYIALRTLARFVGGHVGASLAATPRTERRWYGPALLPQAGVAVGMALVAGEAFPEWADMVMAITIGSTVVFELLGPPLTLYAIRRVEIAQ